MTDIIKKSIENNSALLKELSLNIHSNPELGFEEYKASEWQVQLLKKLKFNVIYPFADTKTAYKASRGSGKPNIAFLAEYDALPDIGHACGHNLIAPCSIAAGTALADTIEQLKIPATVTIFGTPAEEGKGGKIKLEKAGAFKNVDLFLMAHPDTKTTKWQGFLAIRRFQVEFFGLSSHAAAAPELGRNALDATIMLFNGINAMRQHIRDSSRIHGIITHGGTAPNIVPDYSASSFYLRAPTEKYLNHIISRFKKIAKGASLITGTKTKITEADERYKAGLVIDALNDKYIELAQKFSLKNISLEPQGMGSSDFGNVSQIAPGLHANFSITNKNCPLHSKEFAQEAKSQNALDQMLKAAEVLANLALEFVSNTKFQQEVCREFKKKQKLFC